MSLFRRLGIERVAWSLRRLHCPVSDDALVLEVGSGGNPYYRANVLLDAYANTRERHWVPLVADRPMVLGFVERLPFKDNAFDFVIASHVLEHSTNPDMFLKELQRVASAGYIESPAAIMERMIPYRDHRLELSLQDDTLVIKKKPGWRPDGELSDLFERSIKNLFVKELLQRRPFSFHVRYYWDKSIRYKITNPEINSAWDAPESGSCGNSAGSLIGKIKSNILCLARGLMSQSSRNKRIKLLDLLACPDCGAHPLTLTNAGYACPVCRNSYPCVGGIPHMAVGAAHRDSPNA